MAQTETPSGKNYLDPKTLDRVKRLDMRARLVVEGFLTGQHQSPYHGFAVEFASHREYAPGDEIKHIDWKVWSRTDRLYIKEYEEETNLKCTIILDCSKSMRYGEKDGWSKFDYGATLSASLAYMLQQQADSVGLVTFSNQIEKSLAPSGHPSHLKLMLHELQQTEPANRSDVNDVFRELPNQTRKRGLVVLVSDFFLDRELLMEVVQQFRLRQHEVIVFHIMHEHELDFPFQDNTLFRGLEVESQLFTEPRALRRSYLDSVERFLGEVRKVCATAGIDYVLLNTKNPLDGALSSYLSFRQKTRRRMLRK